jgi:hypothetical protein
MVTLLRVVLIRQRREHRLSSPQRGRGAEGEGDTSPLIQLPKLSSGSRLRNTCDNSAGHAGPSLLTPSPRPGEGNSTSTFPRFCGLHLGCSGLSRRRLLADGKQNCNCEHDPEACEDNGLVLNHSI